MRYIPSKLQPQWSPEQITCRVAQDHRDDQSMRISHEGLYKLIYRNAKQGGNIYSQLQRRRKRRRKQAGYGSERGLIANRKRIAERPACVNLKNRYGIKPGYYVQAHGKWWYAIDSVCDQFLAC